jgi:hypothetical protein
MALIDLERAVVELCFDPAPRPEHFEPLGNERVYRIYRDAVRQRLLGELEVAFERTFAVAGVAAVTRAFDHFLSSDPPRTRFFHALVGSFAQSAVPFFGREPGLLPHVADLCAYEAALWAVSDLPDRVAEPISDFDFDKRAVLSPALRLLCLRYPVHAAPAADGGYTAGECHLCVHRRREDKKGRPWTLNPVTYDLMQRFLVNDETVAQAVQHVAEQRGLVVDEKFLDGLCTVLADFIDRGVILGGR